MGACSACRGDGGCWWGYCGVMRYADGGGLSAAGRLPASKSACAFPAISKAAFVRASSAVSLSSSFRSHSFAPPPRCAAAARTACPPGPAYSDVYGDLMSHTSLTKRERLLIRLRRRDRAAAIVRSRMILPVSHRIWPVRSARLNEISQVSRPRLWHQDWDNAAVIVAGFAEPA